MTHTHPESSCGHPHKDQGISRTQPHAGHAHADHDGHAHHHGITANADRRYLRAALLLLLAFMAVEVAAGLWSSSLALISDAGHLLTDAGAIGLALLAMRWAQRPASGRFTFGFKRAEILSAMINGLTLLLLAAWFVIEAVWRLFEPPAVHGMMVTLVALAGIPVNLLAVWVMARANRASLNIEGSYQHILTDLYAFIATAIAGGLIWWTGWNRLDAIAALVVAALMVKSGYELVRDASHVFLEAAPRHLDPQEIRAAMTAVEGVAGVSDLHIWEVTSGFAALAAQVFVVPGEAAGDKRRAIEALLHERFGLEHTTLQMDEAQPEEVCAGCTSDQPGH